MPIKQIVTLEILNAYYLGETQRDKTLARLAVAGVRRDYARRLVARVAAKRRNRVAA